MHLFDSFIGLPQPSEFEYEEWMDRDWKISKINATGKLIPTGSLVAEKIYAEKVLFDIVSYPRDRVFFHEGWFQNTVPVAKNKIKEIAILRLDSDLYESTLVCLRHLYPLVVNGGFIITDDYGLKGCRIA